MAKAEETDEQRIAAQRLRDLERQASDAAAETQAARADAAAVRGDLERARTENAGLHAENERLSAQLIALNAATAAHDGLPNLPIDLPKGAFQLLESITIMSIPKTGEPFRTSARRGDVIILGKADDAEGLQTEVGQVARVYAVEKATVDELRKLKHLR